jgi:hypothetical protein
LGNCLLCEILLNFKSNQNYWDNCFHVKNLSITFEKNWAGYTLGDFFTNSSGHPARNGFETDQKVSKIVSPKIVLYLGISFTKNNLFDEKG